MRRLLLLLVVAGALAGSLAAYRVEALQETVITITCTTMDGTELLLYRGDFRRGSLQIVPPPNAQYKILFQATCELEW